MATLIDPSRLPHTVLRRSEIFLRKQTFRVEDTGVQRLLALYRAAYRDLLMAVDDAGRAAPALMPYFGQRISQLRADVLALLDRLTRAARAGGYYGRLWQLDSITHDDIRINAPFMPRPLDMLSPAVRMAVALEVDDLMLRLRRALLPPLTGGEKNVSGAIRAAMGGVDADGHSNGSFARTNMMTRTIVQRASNDAEMEAYHANAPLIQKVEWVTARDERVCPECWALDGKLYTLPLPSGMRPPPIHPHCRCHLLPMLVAGASTAPDAPSSRWGYGGLEQWSQYNGVTHELTLFLSPKYI